MNLIFGKVKFIGIISSILVSLSCSASEDQQKETTSTPSNSETLQDVDVKGIHIGMTEKELSEKLHSLKIASWDDFTIANAGGLEDSDGIVLENTVRLEFYKGKLDKFSFFFKSLKFQDVLDVVSDKYPEINCQDSILSNYMGMSFEQIKCLISSNNANINLTKYDESFPWWNGSSLVITSKRKVNEAFDKKAKDFY